METGDLSALLKPQRTELLRYLHEQDEISLSALAKALHRSEQSINRDLALLRKYELVHVLRKQGRAHLESVVRPVFAHQSLEFAARL